MIHRIKTSFTPQVCLALVALMTSGLSCVCAATITWTNTSGGSWNVAANWSPNQVPTNTDDVRITAPGNYTVILLSNSTIATLILGAGGGGAGVQTLATTNLSPSANQLLSANPLIVTNGGVLNAHRVSLGGSARINGGVFNTVGGNYVVFPNLFPIVMGMTTVVTNGGVLNVREANFGAPVTVANGGVLNVDILLINSGLPLFVAPGGVMNLLDTTLSGNFAMILGGALTNAGTLNLTNANIFVRNPGAFGNDTGGMITLPGGRVNLHGNGTFVGSTLAGQFKFPSYFINQGMVTQSAQATNLIDVGILDLGQGVITNQAGTLILKHHQITNAANAYPLAGTYHATAGATIEFGATTPFSFPNNVERSPVTLGTPLVLAGGGRYRFTSGLLRLTTVAIPNLELVGDTLQLGPGFQGGAITNLTLNGISATPTLPLTGKLTVTNSTVSGDFTVMNGGTFSGSNAFLSGTVTVVNGGLVNFNGLRSARFNVATGGQLNVAGSWVLGPVTNAGIINITNRGLMDFRNPGGLFNLPSGSVNFVGHGGAISAYFNNSEFFINQGKLTQTSGPGTTNMVRFLTSYDNSQGTVTNSSGNLLLSFQGPISGKYGAAPGAVIKFVGGTSASPLTKGTPLTLVGDCRVSGRVVAPYGTGSYTLDGGYLYLPTEAIPGLGLLGGTLQLGPTFQGGAITNLTTGGISLTNTLPVTGRFNATNGGTIAGNFAVANGGVMFIGGVALSGGITVAGGGRLDVAGLSLSGPLTNAGAINMTNQGVSMINDGAGYRGGIINQPSGFINLWGDASMFTPFGSSDQAYLVNYGNIIKRAGTNASWLDIKSTTNSAVITVESGTIGLGHYGPPVLQPGSSLNVVLNNATNYGKLLIEGNAALAGAFNVALTSGYVPAQGDSFRVVSYDSHSGSFSSLGLPPAVNWQSAYRSTNFVLTVEGITTSSPLPAGTVGTAYNHTLTALGGTLPYTWSVISGGLPAGLSLSTNGVISGTPGMATNASFTARVVGGSLSATKALSLTIHPAAPTITTANPLPAGTAGAAYNLTFGASGSTMPYTWSIVSGSLPVDLSLNTNGVISGTPTVATIASFTVHVVGGNGFSTNKVFGLTIIASALPSAVDSSGLVWTTGGDVPWFAQTTNTHDGADAAQSGLITHGQESWMQTTLTGPGTLTYWRKVSSESGYDYLEFYLDGALQSGRIAGTVDWQKQTNSIPAGAHTVKWRYMKDPECCTEGQDAAWVDEVSYAGPSSLLQFAVANGGPSVSNGLFTTRLMGPLGTNVVVDRSFNLTTWTPWQTNLLPAGGLNLAVPMGTNRQQFFRARMP